ncbi:uncharacterized protein LOC126792384 [Argentina anserina]|uniref:uncharacterized protein LOC126792384 n=1 Tax=Argentina anserina TaxID=57926 RepID=UPI0021763D12|nr:uncharacterized protein LOC126792384 [Potentilla anserina]
MKTSSVRLAVLICLNVFAPKAIGITTPLIKQTCVKLKTHDEQLCINSLSQVPESAHADVKGLAKIMADVVLRRHEVETKNKLTELMKQFPGDLVRLRNCLYYHGAIGLDIDRTVTNYIPTHKYKSAEASMEDAVNLAQQCERLYDGRPPCPVEEENKMAIKLAYLAAGIVVM